jgi:hypothetical protein
MEQVHAVARGHVPHVDTAAGIVDATSTTPSAIQPGRWTAIALIAGHTDLVAAQGSASDWLPFTFKGQCHRFSCRRVGRVG